MIHTDILIIGAGASGLMAAKELSAQDKKVIVLEARDRAGGRIDTLSAKGFPQPVETGAEFVHGNLPHTLQLLKQHHIEYVKVQGSMLHKVAGIWQETKEEVEGWEEMIAYMDDLNEDMTLADFLNNYFKEEKYAKLRKSAIQYARGFDALDENKGSVLSLHNEWQHEEEDQYRIPGGYLQLIDALTGQCLKQHCEIHFSEVVNKVSWQPGRVEVTTSNKEAFSATKLIVTVPISILQNDQAITFTPAIGSKQAAAKQIGFGGVVKILLQFEEAFWLDIKKDALFFFSDEIIPTWWTQYPADSKLLTGWLGGPKAYDLKDALPEEILKLGLQSLNNMFNINLPLLTAWHVANWPAEPHTYGAYSYQTLQSKEAKSVMKEPVENTIYFAGEAVYTGDAQGTVEAALVSGKEVAEQILNEHGA